MFQQFYENNIEAKLIKNILYSVHIPTVQIWKKGSPIIKGFTYISPEYIIVAVADFKGGEGGPETVFDTRYFKIISPYIEGDFYPGITSNFKSKTSYYDSDTHKYLGEYLRLIRDLNGIDLMSTYNCWTGVYNDYIRYNNGNFINLNEPQNDGMQVFIVPIKFNKKYTIYFNSNMPIYVQPCYYYSNTSTFKLSTSNTKNFSKYIYNSSSFSNPIVYNGVTELKGENVVNGEPTSKLIEDYLTLLIQAPKNNSPLIVLEGDYSDTEVLLDKNGSPNRLKDIEVDFNYNITNDDLNKLLKSIPALTRTLDNKAYAFSDRLLEYLLMNVITKDDKYTKDILDIQNRVSSLSFQEAFNTDKYTKADIPGVWSNYLRKYIYDIMLNKKYPSFIDINGFIDKNTEVDLMGDNNG